jgi:hypothetical protein
MTLVIKIKTALDRESISEEGFVKLPNTDGLSVEASTFVAGELGVIAKRAYRKGELLFQVEGPVQPRPTKYSFAVSLDQHIEPERDDGVSDFGHYLNYSCEPNVIVRPVEKASIQPILM